MNRNVLKWIAIVTMTIDHVGLYLLNAGIWMDVFRSIGRIAFPLFAFLVAEGFRKSHHLKAYFLRLFAYAAVIELALFGYYLVTGTNYLFVFNVFIPLVLGLALLILLSQPKPWIRLLAIPIVVFTVFVRYPYGLYGLGLIMAFGLIPRNQRVAQLATVLLLHVLFVQVPGLTSPVAIYPWLQLFALLAMPIIFLYNGEKGKDNKQFFYLFYPVHLGVILLIKILFLS
jgi:hypothetical protein